MGSQLQTHVNIDSGFHTHPPLWQTHNDTGGAGEGWYDMGGVWEVG